MILAPLVAALAVAVSAQTRPGPLGNPYLDADAPAPEAKPDPGCPFAQELQRRTFSLLVTPSQGEPSVETFTYSSCSFGDRDDLEPAYVARRYKGSGDLDLLVITYDTDAGQDPYGGKAGYSSVLLVAKAGGGFPDLGRFKTSQLEGAGASLGKIAIKDDKGRVYREGTMYLSSAPAR